MEPSRRAFACFFASALCFGILVQRSDAAAADLSSCPTALTQLLPCLPFAQGTAKVPTKDCCSNLLTIHETKPQCLCALVAASVNGTAGIPKMNTTLSLTLGPACNVETKPAVCPELLGLSPDDPLNKIFTSGVAATNSTTTTPSTKSPTGEGATVPSAPPPAASKGSTLSLSVVASLILAIVSLVLS